MATILRRFSGELRRFASVSSLSLPRCFVSTSTARIHHFPSPFALHRPIGDLGFTPLPFSHSQIFVRWRTKQTRARAPVTPKTSNVKKYKMKGSSAIKDRTRLLKDGTIRRWKEGNRHNAHSKSKKTKRRIRKPGIVPPARAKVIKKLQLIC